MAARMLTPKKNLRTGYSVWTSIPVPKVPIAKLTSNKKIDVVIVGAGITGAMVAEELSAAGFSAIVLDRRGPLKGATTATTALLQYEIDQPLIKLQHKIGLTKAEQAWRRSKLGLESLVAKIQSLDIACDLTQHRSLYLAGNILNAKQLQEEGQVRNTAGLYTQFLSSKELANTYGMRRTGALQSFANFTANPRKLATGLLRAALKRDVKIFAPVEAQNIKHRGNSIIVETSCGYTCTAKYVVFATGYEIPKYIRAQHLVHSTWAIATKPQPNKLWPTECLIWEASDPYLYLRSTPDGRVICGGEDESFSNEEKRDEALLHKTSVLERKLKALFPSLDTKAEFAWTGSFGSSKTGLPSIGKIPGMKNCYAVMAFGGNGIIFSRIAAEILRSTLLGKIDPDAALFAFD